MSQLRAVINLDLPGPTVSRHLYGHFAEHLGSCIYGGIWVGEESPIRNLRGIRSDVVEALRGIATPNLRWPGGCFADEYHWRDGIGPRESRPSMVNTHWGNVVEDNSFGTHEFMELCEQLGAEPYISGNVGSGTVREMAEWVEYLTRGGDAPMSRLRRENGRSDPWKIKFWGIGNETWGCGGNMRGEYFADLARQYSTYCRDHDGNQLFKIASGARNDDYAWTRALMETMGDFGCGCNPRRHFDAVSFHYYTGLDELKTGSATDFTADEYLESIANAWRVEPMIERHGNVMDVYDPERRIGLVLDEWGTWWAVEPGTNPRFLHQQNALRDALIAGLHFDAFHRNAERLVMANIAQTVNVLQAMLLTFDDVLVKTPTYHVFEMNKDHHDAARLDVLQLDATPTAQYDDRTVPLLTTTATTKGDSVMISITNLDPDAEHTLSYDLRGGTASAVTARILHADTPQAHNTREAPDAVAPADYDGFRLSEHTLTVTIPAHSFVTVRFT
ncbi:MAG TPA: alpha-L-arabinofuranosidase C-terminal domain-containing protein [Microlunatus sp.]|nr:alpha-L-arabinofuranosidase C-terminal domain-containing protein [Microlunatus sp.]